MSAEVRSRESSDRIQDCYGACVHTCNSLAGVKGWSITNVASLQSTVEKSGLQ